jgi:prepilin-type N-terminal cleavage/methylation domain-containing protein
MLLRRRGGLTLLELIVVMIILGMMMALAVALLQGASRELSVPATVTYLDSMVRTARAAARQERAPAWLVFETQGRRISVLASERIGTWHFEDMADGATQTIGSFDRRATFRSVGGSRSSFSAAKGIVGLAVQARADGWIEFPDVPIYDRQQGIVIEFWIYREDTNATQTLLTVGSLLGVTLEHSSHQVRDCTRCGKKLPVRDLQCAMCGNRMAPVVQGRTETGTILRARLGRVDVQTYDRIPPYVWTKVGIRVAAGEARLYINDSLLAAKKGSIDWSGAPAKLSFGARTDGYRGALDEVNVGLVVPREPYALPRDVALEFLGNTKPDKEGNLTLHFDSEGRLDRARHAEPVDLKITGPDGQEQTVRFELNGSVRKQ